MEDAPQCSCGKGTMNLKCAGYGSMNPGRFYYKCPTGKNHWRGFHWYDEYHRLGMHEVPRPPDSAQSQLFNQGEFAPHVQHNEVNGLEMPGVCYGVGPHRGIFEFLRAAICFTVLVLVLGILIGKLM